MQEAPLEDQDRPPADDHLFVGREMSRLTQVLSTVALVVLVGSAALFVWLMSSLPYIEGRIPIKGLQLPATVARDRMGVPHISARSQHDAYFAMGFVHAQDRLWQMELQRRVGAGRLAEVVGARALNNDRFMRTLGLYRLAEASFAQLDKPTREALEAYADGVNSWLAGHRHRLPLEFVLLGYRPEEWRPADSLVWARLMSLQLSGNWHDEAARAGLAQVIDARRIAELFPAYPADAPVTLSAAAADRLLAATPEAAEPRLASNVWAVAGTYTASGRPLLANDPHLGFQAPVMWYLANIEAPGLTLSGATVPGVPFHIIGHNTRIAWGFTTTHADTIDLFVEKLIGDDAYQTPEGARPFVKRDEVIKVKGGADVGLTVRETRHGPVISDVAARDLAGPGEVVAFASAGLAEENLTAQAFHRLNRALDWKGFSAAMRDFSAPVQNVAYADISGNIGFQTVGRVPIRRSGNGTAPARGWTGEADWVGWVPTAKMPQLYNPASGRIVNANNKVVPQGYPFLLAADWPDGYRAQRITDLLKDRRGLTLDDMAAMQLDTLSLPALELKEIMTGVAPPSQRAAEAVRLVAAWDGRADRGRAEPLIFNAWLDRLNHAVFADELKDHFRVMQPVHAAALIGALTRHRHWCDDVNTPEAEDCDQLIARSLEEALRGLDHAYGPDMAKWRWGEAHKASFTSSVLGQVPLVARLANLEIESDGDDFTVNRGSFFADEGEPRFPHSHGAGLRVVYDLADLSRSVFVIATGQSGNPLSRHYDDMMEAWRANRGFRLGDKGSSVLSLEPGL